MSVSTEVMEKPLRDLPVEAPDLVIIHPNARTACYGDVADDAAVEPPLWVRLIAGYVRDRGFTVRIIDAEAEGKTARDVALDVFAIGPRLVCICAYGHQPSASTQQMDAVYETARRIRGVSTARIIVVGGHVSALPERTLRECEAIDYVCVGEGPRTIVGMLAGDIPTDIPGLCGRRSDDGFYRNERGPLIEDLSLLHGDVWHRLPMQKYRAHGWQCLGDLDQRQPYASIYTSLGCPFACTFCCINAPFGARRYRMRDPVHVVSEIVRLRKSYGIRTFKITDEMFVLNEEHYTEICHELALDNPDDDLNIWAYARVDTVKPDTLALMRRAGIRWLALGIESASAHVRDGAKKRFRVDDIRETVRGIQAAGINVIANYIFGLPDDDLASMQATLQMALDLETEWANFYSAAAYPGSPLYDDAVRTGQAFPERWSDYAQHAPGFRPLATEHVDAASVLKFRDEAHAAYFSSPRQLGKIAIKFGPEAAKYAVAQAMPLERTLLAA